MKKCDLLIKNAKVVNSKTCFMADILVDGGVITALGAPGCGFEAEKVIDAAGRYVMPGCVDGHDHMMDPGHTEREDFITGTIAAAAGGITTVTDHHRTEPPSYSLAPLLEKIEYLKSRSVVDFALMGGCSPDNQGELEAMWDAGVTCFKTFTCNLHGVRAMYTGFLLNTMRTVASFGGRMLIHSEDDSIIAYETERLISEGRKDPMAHFESRSKLSEEVAVRTVLAIAKDTGANVGVAHVSQPHLAAEIRALKNQGYPVFSETCAHYFYLTTEDLKKQGPWCRFTPPVNTPDEVEKLRELFNLGYFDTIGSDHCPLIKEDKEKGIGDILKAENGIPGIEHTLQLMLNGVNEGWWTLNRVVECMCENTAKTYGLYPKKGAIEIGCDADIVILDIDKEITIKNETELSKCGWTPHDGRKLKGTPGIVMVRGSIVFENGQVVGKPGYGKFVERVK